MINSLYTLSEINREADSDPKNFVLQSEKRFDESISLLTDKILSGSDNKIIMLAGPSASGKTTSAKKLAESLLSRGVDAYTVSLDDFYMDRMSVPKFEDGNPNFETVYALDLPLLTKCFNEILKYNRTELPVFDFFNGCRAENSVPLELEDDDVVIFEGLHALNPVITERLQQNNLLKVYISIASRIYDNSGKSLLKKRDLRFLRRTVRDYYYRNSSIENTCGLWQRVQFGENEYLFPFRHLADVTVDSFHPYEPCLFKTVATNLLKNIKKGSEFYDECQNIISILDRFTAIPKELVPKDSLMMEFIN